MCQLLPTPSSALYWHIGETTIRFARLRSASFMGENKALVIDRHMQLEGGTQFERADRALNEFCVLWIARWRPKSPADRESGARRFQPITRERMCW